MTRLKTRPDFLRAAKGIRRTSPSFTLELCPTPEPLAVPTAIRVGFTASRKVGGAVERNRAKRRLRAAAVALLPLYGRGGNDYVLVARQETLVKAFSGLLDDLTTALNAAPCQARPDDSGRTPVTNRLLAIARRLAIALLSGPIRLYRTAVSPLLPPSCRFAPSCSHYALEALEVHGPVKGVYLAARRLSRCHPISWLGGASGFDPVPPAGTRP